MRKTFKPFYLYFAYIRAKALQKISNINALTRFFTKKIVCLMLHSLLLWYHNKTNSMNSNYNLCQLILHVFLENCNKKNSVCHYLIPCSCASKSCL